MSETDTAMSTEIAFNLGASRRFDGALEDVRGGLVKGWALDLENPLEALLVEILDNGQVLGSTIASGFRQDLLDAGIGTGCHEFQFALPAVVFDGGDHSISVRPQGSLQLLSNCPIELDDVDGDDKRIDLRGSLDRLACVGALDFVSEDGWITGWAWYPSNPQRRVVIEVLVDGVVIGRTVATKARPDLASASIGDGNYGFSFALPYRVISRPRESLVSVRVKNSGLILPEPRAFRRPEVVDASEKLAQLESDARLLGFNTAKVSNERLAEKAQVVDLFKTVGEFFSQLADAAASGRPPGSLRTLRGAVDDVIHRFAPIEIPFVEKPRISVLLGASSDASAIYKVLRVIVESAKSVPIEVLLFDNGSCDLAALLPLVVRNLRYLHVSDELSPVATLNEMARPARGDVLVFVSPAAPLKEYWFATISDSFAQNPSLAGIASDTLSLERITGNSRGPNLSGGASRLATLPTSDSIHSSRRGAVDFLEGHAFAVRRETWERLGGLDESKNTLDSAFIEICARMRDCDMNILVDSNFLSTHES